MGGIIFDITVDDNRLAITTDKQMAFRKTFVSRKPIKDEVLLQLAYKVCDFLINNENCCKGQHIPGISKAAAVKNRGSILLARSCFSL